MSKIISMDDIIPLLKEQLEHSGEVVFTPKGVSMLPMLRNNKDTVTLCGARFPLKKYQVALYLRDGGQYVLHRVVGIAEDGYIMRGDNQFIDETGIREDQIIAIVDRFNRKGREYTCSSKLYILYYKIWVNTVEIRKWLRRSRRIAGKIKRKILRIFK